MRPSRLTAVSVFLLTLSGCAGSFEEARGPRLHRTALVADASNRCQALDSKRTDYGAVAKGSAVLAGAGALGTLPSESPPARIGIASGALLAGAVAAFAVFEAEGAGQAWARECSR